MLLPVFNQAHLLTEPLYCCTALLLQVGQLLLQVCLLTMTQHW